MRLFVCDRCGVQGSDKKAVYGEPNSGLVRVITVTMLPFSRTMDLCGLCRTALQGSLDDFLGVHPSSRMGAK